ncbi:hypothetical protein E3N88_33371 [Mikania micrantha]|uniref:BRCT domain-containing protein n=1 Tax=Mikania micrantha TaxID=192012 RepID=A0A5N6MBB1_9ASTR|nr:hypothetical protein E3N88_33371 [Mikania micrantha]
MGSLLGFRPPHFSEEDAWLPAWLQPSTIMEASNQAVECQALEHEVQFHLCLSSNDESQYSLNPTLSRFQPDISEFNQALLVQQPEATVIPEEGKAYIIPSQQKGNLGITGPKSPSFIEQKEGNPKVDSGCHKADISDAIELAVTASEALTIHEALKDELMASSVLEAAMRVKLARLENVRENLSSSIKESNEIDCDDLSDLDYLTMTDAYEDVGLTVTSHGDLSGYGSISHVNDSFPSEIGSFSTKQHEQVNSVKLSSKGSILEAFESVTRKEDVDCELLGTKNANLACDVDPVFNCSVEQTDFCPTEVGLQMKGLPNDDLNSSQTILRSNEREDRMTNLVLGTFKSRWFGGWTSKNETSVPAITDNKYTSVPDLFANDTSSLSESADIVPDMSSCMQRHDKDAFFSKSGVAPQHAYEKAINNGDLISDDVAVSPTSSAMDPLCSVVPCSFTSDGIISQNSKHEVNVEKHLGPTVQPILDNLEVNDERPPTVRCQVASLKTYSMLYPRCDPYLDKEHMHDRSSLFEHKQTAKVDPEFSQPEEMTEASRKVDSIVPRRKRIRFSETKISYPHVKRFKKIPQTRLKDPLAASRILTRSKSRPHEVKKHHGEDKKTLFQDLKFLLTGFSVKKHKQIKILIQKNGGMVFDDIPSSTSRRKRCSKLSPLILCPKKLLTTKFLYGCAINALILKVAWLFDSVNEGLVLPHQKYKILNNHTQENYNSGGYNNRFIFDDTAVMLHGKPDFCSKMAKVIKHGGGSVFKTFHWLSKSVDSKKTSVGVIVVEDENGISRQLKQCALEQKVPMMPFDWIIKSLYAGRLLSSPQLQLPGHLIQVEMSEEI